MRSTNGATSTWAIIHDDVLPIAERGKMRRQDADQDIYRATWPEGDYHAHGPVWPGYGLGLGVAPRRQKAQGKCCPLEGNRTAAQHGVSLCIGV